jgi:protein-S-isoprenylcysteine O-methyltransferase Ste14
MPRLIIFGILSIPVLLISWRTLFNIHSHGFYRFFSWECIIWLFVSNYKSWFDDPFSGRQILSWIFLFWSVYLVLAGVLLLRKAGKPLHERNDRMLYQFEKTSELVEIGIFRYIRHPLYSSLLFLTWGILLKNITVQLLVVAVFSTVFLYITALFDEKECISFFGEKYKAYMQRSNRFIPFII